MDDSDSAGHGLAREEGDASLAGCIANLAKTILGFGILTLPGAFKGAGLVWGVVFTVVTAAIGVFSLSLLGEAVSCVGSQPSLALLGERAAGIPGKRFVDLVLVGNNSGAMISYLVIASTTLFKLTGSTLPRQVFVVLSIILISPLCLVRNVNTLRFSSSVALTAILILVVMIVLFAIPWRERPAFLNPCGDDVDPTQCRGVVAMSQGWSSVLAQFVIFTNAYTCQQGAIPVLAELHRPTHLRRFLVGLGAILVVLPLFLLISIAGYTTFGDNVDSDVLLNYSPGIFVLVARVGMVLDVLTSYPLMMYFTRTSMGNLLMACGFPCRSAVRGEGVFTTDKLDIVAVACLVGFSMSVSLCASDLGVVAALTGAVGATSLGYVLPGFLYWKLSQVEEVQVVPLEDRKELIPKSKAPQLVTTTWMRVGALSLLSLGVILLPVGVTLTFVRV